MSKRFNLRLARRRPRITYANVVSTLALFLALGGVSWAAATLPKNSVGSKQLKKNAVTNAKVKNQAITSSKIKRGTIVASNVKAGSITGDRLDLASLGKVPSAASADALAGDVGPVTKRVAASASAATWSAAVAAATEVPLATVGQISLYGKCFVVTGANVLYGSILMRASADGAAAINTWDSYTGTAPTFLNTSTPEDSRLLTNASVANDSANVDNEDDMTVIGPDGTGANVGAAVWMKHGTVSGSSPLLAYNDQCMFHLYGHKLSL